MTNTTWAICSVEQCDLTATGRGWCSKHYQRWRRHGDPEGGRHYPPRARKAEDGCVVKGCTRPGKSKGLCGAHYRRRSAHGDVLDDQPVKDPFDYEAEKKTCTGCGELKPLNEYHRVNRKSRYVARCKVCRNLEIKAVQRKRLYGVTEEEYAEMIAAQDGKCAICGSSHRLCIDHDHRTGKVRKILCDRCNRALGVVDDDAGLMGKLIEYLEQH